MSSDSDLVITDVIEGIISEVCSQSTTANITNPESEHVKHVLEYLVDRVATVPSDVDDDFDLDTVSDDLEDISDEEDIGDMQTELIDISCEDLTTHSDVVDYSLRSNKGECLICRKKIVGNVRWRKHIESNSHKRKESVYNTLNGDDFEVCPDLVGTCLFTDNNTRAIGEDHLYEFHRLVNGSPDKCMYFWACDTCYVGGRDEHSASKHVLSDNHRLNIIGQYYPRRMSDVGENVSMSLDKIACVMKEERVSLPNLRPEVLLVKPGMENKLRDKCLRSDISVVRSLPKCYKHVPTVGESSLIFCEICRDCFVVDKKRNLKAIQAHRMTTNHREVLYKLKSLKSEKKGLVGLAADWQVLYECSKLANPVGLQFIRERHMQGKTDLVCRVCAISFPMQLRFTDHVTSMNHMCKSIMSIYPTEAEALYWEKDQTALKHKLTDIVERLRPKKEDIEVYYPRLAQAYSQFIKHNLTPLIKRNRLNEDHLLNQSLLQELKSMIECEGNDNRKYMWEVQFKDSKLAHTFFCGECLLWGAQAMRRHSRRQHKIVLERRVLDHTVDHTIIAKLWLGGCMISKTQTNQSDSKKSASKSMKPVKLMDIKLREEDVKWKPPNSTPNTTNSRLSGKTGEKSSNKQIIDVADDDLPTKRRSNVSNEPRAKYGRDDSYDRRDSNSRVRQNNSDKYCDYYVDRGREQPMDLMYDSQKTRRDSREYGDLVERRQSVRVSSTHRERDRSTREERPRRDLREEPRDRHRSPALRKTRRSSRPRNKLKERDPLFDSLRELNPDVMFDSSENEDLGPRDLSIHSQYNMQHDYSMDNSQSMPNYSQAIGQVNSNANRDRGYMNSRHIQLMSAPRPLMDLSFPASFTHNEPTFNVESHGGQLYQTQANMDSYARPPLLGQMPGPTRVTEDITAVSLISGGLGSSVAGSFGYASNSRVYEHPRDESHTTGIHCNLSNPSQIRTGRVITVNKNRLRDPVLHNTYDDFCAHKSATNPSLSSQRHETSRDQTIPRDKHANDHEKRSSTMSSQRRVIVTLDSRTPSPVPQKISGRPDVNSWSRKCDEFVHKSGGHDPSTSNRYVSPPPWQKVSVSKSSRGVAEEPRRSSGRRSDVEGQGRRSNLRTSVRSTKTQREDEDWRQTRLTTSSKGTDALLQELVAQEKLRLNHIQQTNEHVNASDVMIQLLKGLANSNVVANTQNTGMGVGMGISNSRAVEPRPPNLNFNSQPTLFDYGHAAPSANRANSEANVDNRNLSDLLSDLQKYGIMGYGPLSK